VAELTSGGFPVLLPEPNAIFASIGAGTTTIIVYGSAL
jgi:hypothetical protein